MVIVAGDSDYIALAQRCKRLGRYVSGIGVAGSTSKSLAAACDDFVTYDDLPGVARAEDDDAEEVAAPIVARSRAAARGTAARDTAAAEPTADAAAPAEAATETAADPVAAPKRRRSTKAAAAQEPVVEEPAEEPGEDPQVVATRLLARAMQLGHEKDDAEWLHSSTVKGQMKRMDPSFSEKSLGYRSFSDFIKSRSTLVELDDSSTAQMLRLAPTRAARRAQHSGRVS